LTAKEARLQAIENWARQNNLDPDKILSGEVQFQPQARQIQPEFELPTFSAEIQRAVKSGQMDTETGNYFGTFAKLQDNVLNQVYGAMAQLAGMVQEIPGVSKQIRATQRDMEWQSFPGRDSVNRPELESFRDKHNYGDYDTAARAMAVTNPQRFEKLLKALEVKAEQRVAKKLRLNYERGNRGGGGGAPSPVMWKNFQTGDGGINEQRLDQAVAAGKMTMKQRDEICDKILADIERRGL
jgi:hypothetical protein